MKAVWGLQGRANLRPKDSCQGAKHAAGAVSGERSGCRAAGQAAGGAAVHGSVLALSTALLVRHLLLSTARCKACLLLSASCSAAARRTGWSQRRSRSGPRARYAAAAVGLGVGIWLRGAELHSMGVCTQIAAACICASLCITQGPARCKVWQHSRCSTAGGVARTLAQRCSRERALLSAAACFWSRLLGEPLAGAGSACTAGAVSHEWDRAGGGHPSWPGSQLPAASAGTGAG